MKKIISLLIVSALANIFLAISLHAQPAAQVDLAEFERQGGSLQGTRRNPRRHHRRTSAGHLGI